MATILGLLLVVTFIANYLTTTLPNQMQVNDLNHELAVENQLGRLQAVLEAASSSAVIGAQFSQPLSLGSAGAPPFGNPDKGSVAGGYLTGGLTVSYTVMSSSSSIPISMGGSPGGVVALQLTNAYIPSAEIAFDQGAVAFAQEGGYPLLVEGPSISYTGSVATLWIPGFTGSIGSTSGLGTVDLTFRLLSVQIFALPAPGYTLPASGSILVTIVTPYAQAWSQWFAASGTLGGLPRSCTPVAVCTGAFQMPGPLGTVTLSIPMTGLTSLTVTTASFAIGVS